MIVVTAPTGQIGSHLLPTLLHQGEPVRVVVRDPARLPAAVRARVEIVTGSHRDREVVDRALAGADSLFWLMPSDREAPGVYESYVAHSAPAADAVVRHRVARVVTISALGRGTRQYAGLVSASLAMDDLFGSTGAHLRALAMPSFMDNKLWQVPGIAARGVIRGTLPGDHRAPTVATRDIAAVASRLLLDHAWTGREDLAVLGPEDLTPNEEAAILTQVLGRPIRYQRQSLEEQKQALLLQGASEAMAQAMIDMDLAKERGIDNALPRTPESTTPTSLRRWSEDVLKPALAAHEAARPSV